MLKKRTLKDKVLFRTGVDHHSEVVFKILTEEMHVINWKGWW